MTLSSLSSCLHLPSARLHACTALLISLYSQLVFEIGCHVVAQSGLTYSVSQVDHFLALASSVVGFQVCATVLSMVKPFESQQ